MAKKVAQKDFLKTIAAVAAEARRRIEAGCAGFDPDPKAAAARRDRARSDFGFFCRTYFPHHVSSAPSRFHLWSYERLPAVVFHPQGLRVAIAAPRGNAKTTTWAQLGTLWCLAFGHKRFPVIISDAFDQSAIIVEGIKAELEANPRLNNDFPDLAGVGPVWQVGVIVTRTGSKVAAFGSGKRLHGVRHGTQRPDIVFLDDLENDENVKSPEQRDKLERWIDRAVDPLGPPDGSMDIIYVGTVLHYDAVFSRKLKNPMWRSQVFRAIAVHPHRQDLWDKWEEVLRNDGEEAADAYHAGHRAEMDDGAAVIWPEVQPYVMLRKIKVRIGASAFATEYQNEPSEVEDQLFGRLIFWVQPSRFWVYYGVCDPSLGKHGGRGDPSAILVGARDRETGILDVVEADIRRRLPDTIIENIIALHRQYRCQKWGIETVQFQEFLRMELVRRSAVAGCPVPAVAILNHADKALRIESLQPHCANGLIRFNPNHATLLQQLRHFPNADHDDGPDALEMLWRISLGARTGSGIRTAGPRSSSGRAMAGFLGG